MESRTPVPVKKNLERVFALGTGGCYPHLELAFASRLEGENRDGGFAMTETTLTGKRREILDFIDAQLRDRGFPPSVREIGEAVGLTSSSTVHAHLATLQRQGFLRRDPTKPRAIEVRYDPASGSPVERRPVRHVPLVGDVAAGTDVLAQENIEEMLPLPADFTGEGELFMLRVRGDSMVGVGILDGDHVVARVQDTADKGDIVVAGIPGEEATVKTFDRRGGKVVLVPHNPRLEPMMFDPPDVTIYGRVVTVLRKV
jgi:repressor LexA